MTCISKVVDNFTEAENFIELLDKYGAYDVRTTAVWSAKEKQYIITVSGRIS